MPRLAPHDSRNPTECSEERIDEQQHGRREHEDPQTGGRAPERSPRAARSSPSRSRAAPTAPSGSSCRRARAPRARRTTRPRSPQPPQQRREQRQHERDVLARHRGEVREPGGAELLGQLGSGRRACRRAGTRRAARSVDRLQVASSPRARAGASRWRRERAVPRAGPTPTISVACTLPDRVPPPPTERRSPSRSVRASRASDHRLARLSRIRSCPATSPDRGHQHADAHRPGDRRTSRRARARACRTGRRRDRRPASRRRARRRASRSRRRAARP